MNEELRNSIVITDLGQLIDGNHLVYINLSECEINEIVYDEIIRYYWFDIVSQSPDTKHGLTIKDHAIKQFRLLNSEENEFTLEYITSMVLGHIKDCIIGIMNNKFGT